MVADLRRGVRIWYLLADREGNAEFVANRKADDYLKIVVDISLAYRNHRKETEGEKP